MSVVAAETQTALRARVRDYLRDNGTLAPTAVIRRGKIESWRQLPEAPTPPGQST